MEPLLRSQQTSFELSDLSSNYDQEAEKQYVISEPWHRRYTPKLLLWLYSLSIAVLPSFISTLLTPPIDRPSLRRTSALDGLRGVGAFCVVNYHIISAFENFVNYGYGLQPAEAYREPHCNHNREHIEHNLRIHQLPGIRLIYSGSAPVCIFFVLSGFVLSYRSWKLVRAHNVNATFPIISSSTFRRFFRLFLPTTCSTFIVMLLIRTGAWDYPAAILADKSIVTAESETHQARLHTFGAQLVSWLSMMWDMTNIFTWEETYPSYDVHLWTIPMEFRSSLLLFLALIVLVRMRRVYRIISFILLILYCYNHNRWVTVLFLSGSMLAESSLVFDASPAIKSRIARALISFTRCFLIALALFFLSAPDKCVSRTPGYITLASLIPSWDVRNFRFYPSLGAIILVGVVSHSSKESPLWRWLDSDLIQYLGWTSYSLYIVHGPVMHGLGYRIFPFIWHFVGRDSTVQYVTGFVLAWFLTMLIIFWVADRFTVIVDENSVRFAKWVEEKVLSSQD